MSSPTLVLRLTLLNSGTMTPMEMLYLSPARMISTSTWKTWRELRWDWWWRQLWLRLRTSLLKTLLEAEVIMICLTNPCIASDRLNILGRVSLLTPNLRQICWRVQRQWSRSTSLFLLIKWLDTPTRGSSSPKTSISVPMNLACWLGNLIFFKRCRLIYFRSKVLTFQTLIRKEYAKQSKMIQSLNIWIKNPNRPLFRQKKYPKLILKNYWRILIGMDQNSQKKRKMNSSSKFSGMKESTNVNSNFAWTNYYIEL